MFAEEPNNFASEQTMGKSFVAGNNREKEFAHGAAVIFLQYCSTTGHKDLHKESTYDTHGATTFHAVQFVGNKVKGTHVRLAKSAKVWLSVLITEFYGTIESHRNVFCSAAAESEVLRCRGAQVVGAVAGQIFGTPRNTMLQSPACT
jgi:hypothetical protein